MQYYYINLLKKRQEGNFFRRNASEKGRKRRVCDWRFLIENHLEAFLTGKIFALAEGREGDYNKDAKSSEGPLGWDHNERRRQVMIYDSLKHMERIRVSIPVSIRDWSS